MPIQYGNEVTDGSTLKFQVCIVGAGAVGITIAKELYKKGKSVVVLESGIVNEYKAPFETPRNYDPLVGVLDEGNINKFINKARPGFLTSSRTRCYGGSTNCWGGWIRPLDPYDMKDWIISYSDLPYKDALELVQLQNLEDFDKPSVWIKRLQSYLELEDQRATFDSERLNKCGLKTAVIQQQTDEVLRNFQQQFGWLFEDNNGNITLIRNGTALEFVDISSGVPASFNKLCCGTLDPKTAKAGTKFFIQANYFVLAMGGLEITRFLLINQQKFKSSIPLSNANIGKFYMNHPRVSNCIKGGIPLSKPAEASKFNTFYGQASPIFERRNNLVQAYIVPTEQSINRQKGPLNFRLQVGVLGAPDQNNLYPAYAEINFEQSPNEKSIISVPTENNTVDLFGQLKLKIDWNFNDVDKETYTRAMDFFADFIVNQMHGKISAVKPWDEVNNWPPLPPDPNDNEFYTGDHHLGTTRMALGTSGVVTSTGLVQNSQNLFICSTSIFPTGGWANSTLTLLALAIRLGKLINGFKS